MLLPRTRLPVGHILKAQSAHGLLRVVSAGRRVCWDDHLAGLLGEETGFLIVPNALHIGIDLVVLHALLLAKLAHHALVQLPLLQEHGLRLCLRLGLVHVRRHALVPLLEHAYLSLFLHVLKSALLVEVQQRVSAGILHFLQHLGVHLLHEFGPLLRFLMFRGSVEKLLCDLLETPPLGRIELVHVVGKGGRGLALLLSDRGKSDRLGDPVLEHRRVSHAQAHLLLLRLLLLGLLLLRLGLLLGDGRGLHLMLKVLQTLGHSLAHSFHLVQDHLLLLLLRLQLRLSRSV